jgi:hypothetical protein
MLLRCPKCKNEFVQFLREPQTTNECRKCGAKIPLDALARFEFTCPDCKKVSYGRTNVEYAKFVNDGHWTNPKGIERRFVPGHWEKANGKGRFIYTPGEKTGMVLKMKWVEGSHYWESSIRILERLYPELLEKKLQSWLDEYFKDFL